MPITGGGGLRELEGLGPITGTVSSDDFGWMGAGRDSDVRIRGLGCRTPCIRRRTRRIASCISSSMVFCSSVAAKFRAVVSLLHCRPYWLWYALFVRTRGAHTRFDINGLRKKVVGWIPIFETTYTHFGRNARESGGSWSVCVGIYVRKSIHNYPNPSHYNFSTLLDLLFNIKDIYVTIFRNTQRQYGITQHGRVQILNMLYFQIKHSTVWFEHNMV